MKPISQSPSDRARRPGSAAYTPEPASVADARLTAFAGLQRVVGGSLAEVTAHLRAAPVPDSVLLRVFDDATGALVPLDLRAPPATPVPQQPGDLPPASVPTAAPPRGVGRPKLGVVAREVTLLPEHWDWLAAQPGGASVALRKLVHEARRKGGDLLQTRQARDRAYHAMSTLAGNLAGFEEAARALFAGEHERLITLMAVWPKDVREYVLQLAEPAAG